MPYFKKKAAYLYGKFTTNEKSIQLNLKVKSNLSFHLFTIISVMIGIIIILYALSNIKDVKLYLTLGFTFLLLGIINYPVSILLKNQLHKKVVKYLDLIKE